MYLYMYLAHKKRYERFYGRAYVTAAFIPYFISLFSQRSVMSKLFTSYLLFTVIDALYDMGVYSYFLIHGPTHMKKLLVLPPAENFGSI